MAVIAANNYDHHNITAVSVYYWCMPTIEVAAVVLKMYWPRVHIDEPITQLVSTVERSRFKSANGIPTTTI